MPIKGLTDRGLSFPEIGQIRKGAPKQPNRPGEDLTYFRVIFDEKETEAARIFQEVYKEKPEEIRIFLPFNELPRMWDAWYEGYTAGRLVARADGEYFTWLIDTETGEVLVKGGIDVKTGAPRSFDPKKAVGYYTNSKTGKKEPVYAKPIGRLKVIIPELQRAAYLTVMTTSVWDIIHISEQFEAFSHLNNGQIAGIPFVLRRRPKMISCPDPNNPGLKVRRKKSLLSIEADPDWVKRSLSHYKKLALPGNGLPLLPEGEDDPVEGEASEIDEEWYPEDSAAESVTEEIKEPEEASEEKAPEKPMNGSARPYAPSILRAKLLERAKLNIKHTVTEKQRGLLVMLLNEAYQGDEDKRHTFQWHILDATSMNDLSDAMIYTMLTDWLRPKQDSGGAYIIDAMAARELQMAYEDALKTEGQQELPL